MKPDVANQSATDPIRTALNDIVEWSTEQPDWQRDALRRLYSQEKLTSSDMNDLNILCRQKHNLLDQNETRLVAQFLEAEHIPTEPNSVGAIALKSIGRMQNVNALADDQHLTFSETGLTIIYGDNGSGKSGYGRVLKKACRARNQEPILPNAYTPSATGKPAAQIKYSVGGTLQPEVAWQDGVAAHHNLSNISVFDSKCASVHVDEKTELAYTPVPLQLLQLLADTCRAVGDDLKTRKRILEIQHPNFKQRTSDYEGTKVHQLILTLSAATQIAPIRSLATVSEQEHEQIDQLKRNLASDPATEIRRLKTLKQRIEQLVTAVQNSERILLPKMADELRQLLITSKEKAEAVQLAASEAFKREALPQAGSEAWKTLWEAARAFSTREAYQAAPFPNVNTDAVCVLCQQPLSGDAKKRLTAFENFVQQKVQQASDEARNAVEGYKRKISGLCAPDETLREAVLLLRDELAQPQICRDVIRNLARARVRAKRFTGAKDLCDLGSHKPFADVSSKLVTLIATVDQRIADIEKTSDPEQRKVQEHALHELKDRVWLSSILPDVEAEVDRLKKITALNNAIQDTDTTRITRKVTEMARSLVTNTIRDAFAAEITALRMADRRIELIQEQSGYGSTKFKVSLIRSPKAKVADILSEGEHRCVAVAAFLAELATAHNKSGVIFDDPISSLDHNYREAVAARLAKEAAGGRQVIVFTHDIPFLMMLDHEARNAGIAPNYQCVNRASDRAGICTHDIPSKARSVSEIADKVERQLVTTRVLHENGRLSEWSDQIKMMTESLREGWERAAEAVVSHVVRRYNNAVHTGGLRKLTVLTDADCNDLKEGYEFCCNYCHTAPAEVNPPAPTPDEIKNEIDRLRLWSENIRTRQEQKK